MLIKRDLDTLFGFIYMPTSIQTFESIYCAPFSPKYGIV